MKKHAGEIVEKAIRNSSIPISLIAKRLGYSRRRVYNFFTKETLPLELILKISKIIDVNLTSDFPS